MNTSPAFAARIASTIISASSLFTR